MKSNIENKIVGKSRSKRQITTFIDDQFFELSHEEKKEFFAPLQFFENFKQPYFQLLKNIYIQFLIEADIASKLDGTIDWERGLVIKPNGFCTISFGLKNLEKHPYIHDDLEAIAADQILKISQLNVELKESVKIRLAYEIGNYHRLFIHYLRDRPARKKSASAKRISDESDEIFHALAKRYKQGDNINDLWECLKEELKCKNLHPNERTTPSGDFQLSYLREEESREAPRTITRKRFSTKLREMVR